MLITKVRLIIYLLTTLVVLAVDSQNTWTKRFEHHMFPYGPEAGDEKIQVDELPVVRDAYRSHADTIKIFKDGHIELQNERRSSPNTPFIAPYHLPYSDVTSGHVWYRETQDQDILAQVAAEIQTAFPDDGLIGDPDSMIVVTWQYQNVEPHYPECDPENLPDNLNFCNCLAFTLDWCAYPHLLCECDYFHLEPPRITNTCACQCSRSNYRFCSCNNYMSSRSYDWEKHCICDARGGSGIAAYFAATMYNQMGNYIPAIESCDFTDCDEGTKMGYCRCTELNDYIELGMMRCFLLHASGYGDILIHIYLPSYPLCPLLPSSLECDCVLPDTLTEAEMMDCLLGYGYHDYIWLCDEDDVNLDYCTCIQTRTSGDVNDEIYCKCVGRDDDLCQCLADYGYSGTESCSGTGRSLDYLQYSKLQVKREETPEYMNTFQLSVVYNRWQTFVFFTYKKLEYRDMYVMTKLGYINEQTSTFLGYTHPYPEDPMFLHFLLFDSNINVDGRWIYKMDGDVQQPDWTPRTDAP